jgi:hypothetical protein
VQIPSTHDHTTDGRTACSRGAESTLSIIIPTLGRETLRDTILSVDAQMRDDDEVIVVCDKTHGNPDAAARVLTDVLHDGARRRRFTLYTNDATPAQGIGGTQRALGIARARGTHLAFMDDDDVYAPGALDAMRRWACGVPVIFRMDHPALGVVWKEQRLVYGNVGMPMVVVPRDDGRLGNFRPYAEDGHGTDFAFVQGCVERMGAPVWREEVIAVVGPEGSR